MKNEFVILFLFMKYLPYSCFKKNLISIPNLFLIVRFLFRKNQESAQGKIAEKSGNG